ncbi:hypothetical protein OIU74_029630 [Salix koriyanagi]|uniref:DUF630 family protein n=1 Tax=Salix koriyanagi TaxID=2511006 RepID=A0A9Q0VFA2_9ROSI|nr:hypothetical protein OIU74_029630 [Salix koriyanagi]
MGCTTSKLDEEEAVQLCKDRKRYIKQAVEQRTRFASGHLAYIQSLKRLVAALRDYVEGDEPREFLLDSFITPPFTPVKKTSPGFISISPKSFSATPIQSGPTSTLKVNYLRSGGNRAVSVEERPQSPETFRVESYSPMHHYGADGFFAMQSSPMYSSFFSYSPNNRPNIPPPSPRTSQWDGFWNPFSSLDYYGYPNRSSFDQMGMDDDIRGLRQVREEEGIPDLEDETEQDDSDNRANLAGERAKAASNYAREEVLVEDVDEDEDEEDDETDSDCECEHEVEGPPQSGLQSQGSVKIELSRSQNSGQVEFHSQEMAAGNGEAKVETPGFTVYVNRRPTSMAEVIKDLEEQFTVICNSAKEVSDLLESSRAQYSSTSNEHTAIKMLNPVALIRSASSRSSSSRFMINSSSSKDEDCDSSSDFSEESCMHSGSHQSTFGQIICLGEETLSRSEVWRKVEAVSKRIETLRDEELQPQLLELVQGLARMWKVMAECHQSQKRTLDEAKLFTSRHIFKT